MNNSSVNYENQILDSIQLLVDSAVNKAGYDRTIKASIVKCIDSTIGKYLVRYQDTTFYAYATNTNISYISGTSVYILVPSGDLSQTKTIIGAVNKLGTDYVTATDDEDNFDTYGKDCIIDFSAQAMSSYARNNGRTGYKKVIFSSNQGNENNEIGIDVESAKRYIPNCKYIICGATFRTNLDAEQKLQGNYGVGYTIEFYSQGASWEKTYIIDVNNMLGDPYNFTSESRQRYIFAIDGKSFVKIKEIFIFTNDFPNMRERDLNEDIWITNFELTGANMLSEEALSSYTLTFNTPDGIYLKKNLLEELSIEANVRMKGKTIDIDSQSLKYYWFIENEKITEKSQLYNRYGGAGWECLNEYRTVSESSADRQTDNELIEWIPGSYRYVFNSVQSSSMETTLKCAAVYTNDTVISNEITLYRDDTDKNSFYKVEVIEKNGRTQFHNTNEVANLECKIYLNGVQKTSGLSYSWISTDVNGGSEVWGTTSSKLENIKAGTITEKTIYKCTVTENSTKKVLGTGVITLSCYANSSEGLYIAADTFLPSMRSCASTLADTNVYVKLCNIRTLYNQGRFTHMKIFIGNGNNGVGTQNAYIDLILQDGWFGDAARGRMGGASELHPCGSAFTNSSVKIYVLANSVEDYDIWLYVGNHSYVRANYYIVGTQDIILTHDGETKSKTAPSGGLGLCDMWYGTV